MDKNGSNLSQVLVIASQCGNLETVEYLLGVEGVDANYEDEDGDSPLHTAVQRNHKSIVDILLKMLYIYIFGTHPTQRNDDLTRHAWNQRGMAQIIK